MLFVVFLADFFFGFSWEGEKQRKGVVWVLSCFLFSFFPFLPSFFFKASLSHQSNQEQNMPVQGNKRGRGKKEIHTKKP